MLAPEGENADRWRKFGPLAAGAVVLLMRLAALSSWAVSPHYLPEGGDMRFYHDWALRVLEGRGADGTAFYGLPGYPYLLAGIYAVAGVDPFAAGLVQAVCEGLIGGVIFALGASLFPGARGVIAGASAALGWAFYQPAAGFSIILMPTTFAVLALWGIVAWVARSAREKRGGILWPWGGMGLCAGLVATVVATVLFAVPLILAGAALRFKKALPAALAGLACLAGVAAGTAPCWVYHRFVAREPVFLSAHSGLNVFLGNHAGATGYPQAPPGMRLSQKGMLADSITMAEAAEGRALKKHEVSAHWEARAKAFVEGDRAAWARLMGVKAKNFWNAFEYDDLGVLGIQREAGVVWPGLRFGVVAAFGLPALALFLARGGAGAWVACGVLGHMGAVLAVFITERYRLAAVPGLLVLGAGGLVWLGGAVAGGRHLRAAAYAALGLLGAWWVGGVPREPGLWSLGHFGTGIKQLAARDLPGAERNLAIAYRYVDGNAEILFALGNLALEQGRGELARGYYRRAASIDPRHARARNNLGVLSVEAGAFPEALAALREAVALEPENGKTRYLLAKALEGTGDRAGALAAAREAVALDPGRPEYAAYAEALGIAEPGGGAP